MNELARNLLREIYYSTERNQFIHLHELETLTGQSGATIRAVLEDLKSQRLIIENEYQFEVSNTGRDFIRSREP